MRIAVLLLAQFSISGFQTAASQAFWRSPTGPMGGKPVYSHFVQEPSVWLATTPTDDVLPMGGFYLSNDAGVSWRQVFSLQIFADEVHFGVSPTGDIIAGVESLLPDDSYASAFRSLDGGSTWEEVGPRNMRVNDILLSADGTLLVATHRGAFALTERGAVWTLAGLESHDVLTLFSTATGELYAGTKRGLYSSSDGGESWSPKGFLNEEVTAVESDSDGDLVVGTSTGLYAQHDEQWVASGLDTTTWAFDASSVLGEWAATPKGLFHRSAAHAHWEKVILPARTVRSVRIRDNAVFAGTSRGLFRSTDGGGHWDVIGVPDTEVNAIGVSTEGSILAGTNTGLHQTVDSGRTWSASAIDQWIDSIARCANGDLVVGAGFFGGVHRSRDGGRTWTYLGLPEVQISSVACNSDILIVLANQSAHQYSEPDSSWTEQTRGLENVKISEVKEFDGTIFLVSRGGLFRLNQEGDTWTQIGTVPLDFFEFAPDGTVYGAIDQRLYRSDDGGYSWNRLPHTSSSWVTSIAVEPGGTVFISEDGVFASSDRGMTWKSISEGLPISSYDAWNEPNFVEIQDLAIGFDGHLYAGTRGHGVVQSLTPVATFASNSGIFTDGTGLEAHPNPFSTQITFSIVLGRAAMAELSVYNALGKKVEVLFSDWLQPGVHEVKWLGKGSASGAYYGRPVTDLGAYVRPVVKL